MISLDAPQSGPVPRTQSTITELRRPAIGHSRVVQVRRAVKKLLACVLMALIGIWSWGPIYVTISSAFKRPLDIFAYPPRLWPAQWTVTNINHLLSGVPEFLVGIRNSAILTLCTTLVTVGITFPAAYGLSRSSSRLLRGLSIGAIIFGMFPRIIITVPLFPILNDIGLQNSRITLVVLYSAAQSTVIVWIMKAFIDRIPVELEQAAFVDGASRLQAFLRIVVPLSRPILVAGAVLAAVSAWNEYIFALLFTSGSTRTTPVIIAGMINDLSGPNWGAILSASMLQFIPAVIFLVWVQRRIVADVAAGALVG